jgi:zinc transporter, ZIP family
MGEAIGWGALAASSLVIGAFLSFARKWPERQVGYVLSFGAGALFSAVSFELAAEGIEVGGAGITGVGLGVGALTYYFLDGLIARRMATGRGRQGRSKGSGSGTALALGAFLDGIPEQLVLGINIAAGALLVMLIDSMIPDARSDAGRGAGLVTVLGFAVAAGLSSLS